MYLQLINILLKANEDSKIRKEDGLNAKFCDTYKLLIPQEYSILMM